MKWLIYKHTLQVECEHKGWSYIGQTSRENPNERWCNGKGYNRENHGKVFYRAIKKYGWENFTHEILEDNIGSQEEANAREIFWIAYYHTYIKSESCRGYNMTPGGDQWGNLAGHWYTDGNSQIVVLPGDLPPDGFKPGKLPWSEEQKQFLSEYSKAHGYGIRLGKQNLGRVHIHKDNVDKSIYKDELDNFLQEGWLLGRSKRVKSKNFKKVLCIETEEIFESVKAATDKYGSHVMDVLRGTRNKTHNCHFKYL